MTHRPLDPRKCPVAIDANALNRDGSAHDGLVDRLLALSSAGTIRLLVPKRVREEILDPRTPAHIQEAALPRIFSYSVGLNSDEQRRHRIITQELQGNAKPGKHEADADHLFEAAKYGGFFITHDARILTRAGRLGEALPPSLTVVTLADFSRSSTVGKRDIRNEPPSSLSVRRHCRRSSPPPVCIPVLNQQCAALVHQPVQ